MTRRAESVDETRLRITAATAHLHTTIGPANTTIAGIAEEAGVTRLTVYRHFDDLEVLFAACRAHWRSENPPPDPRGWPAISGLEPRVRHGLTAFYGWYRSHAEELFPIYRDMSSMPASAQQTMRDENRRLADLLLAGDAPDGAAGRDLRVAACHLLDYRTWRSLTIDLELTDGEAVELGVTMLTAVAAAPKRRPRGSRGPDQRSR